VTIRSLNNRLDRLDNSGVQRCPVCAAVLPADLLRPRPPVFVNNLEEVASVLLPKCPHCFDGTRTGCFDGPRIIS
jgi:hypothetical protein